MKKYWVFFLVILLCVTPAALSYVKNQKAPPDLESQDEQLLEALSRMTVDELNAYISELHILDLTQSDILNERYPFPDDVDEILREALSGMGIDELDAYVHRLYFTNTSND